MTEEWRGHTIRLRENSAGPERPTSEQVLKVEARENAGVFERCMSFVEGRLNRSDFIPGMDWRDAVPNYVGNCLLSNQLFLARTYECWGEDEKARQLKARINQTFFSPDDGFYADCVWWEGTDLRRDFRFDSGNALAVLHEVRPRNTAKKTLDAFEGARSQFGYKKCLSSSKD